MTDSDFPSFETFARESLGGAKPDWTPYPWQIRFAERWADPDAPPLAWVIAPTGAGKTAVLDALVWALARQADLAPAERTATTRIVWAIDRRVLVDEVHEHALALAERLEQALDAGPGADSLHEVASRLFRLACIGRKAPLDREERQRLGLQPLAVQRWRGGIAREEQLLSPFQPQIIASTVAQIGSRLLFRGYGLGERSLQVGAGLAAVDTTICLDEAHLAAPFQETVEAIRTRRAAEPLSLPPLHLLTLTATPPEAVDDECAIGIEEADRVRLGKRWNGRKTLELRDEQGTKPEQGMVAAVEELLADGSRVIACVVNQVRLAGSVHRALEKKLGDAAKVVLLIGPQRLVDRERELAAVRGPLLDGKDPQQPVVVVATQTIEVGLDADFDGMVTQSASASALVQRLGRLNRSGDRPGRCIVIRDQKSPLYEEDEAGAWEWLVGRPGAPAEIDVSVAALADVDGRPSDKRRPPAATLTDAAVTQLMQTSPRPGPWAEPDIEPLLKGIGVEPRGDVQIVWRHDLRFALDEDEDLRERLTHYRQALLELARPEAREMLPRTVASAKRLLGAWLADPQWTEKRKPPTSEGADIEGGDDAEEPWREMTLAPFLVVRGRAVLHGSAESDQAKGTIALKDIAPGDTVVVPTTLLRSDGAIFPGPTWNIDDVMADRDQPPGSAPEQSGGELAETSFRLRVSWEALMPTRPPELTKAPTPADEGARRKRWDRWCLIASRVNELDLSAKENQYLPVERVRELLGSDLDRTAPTLDAWLERLAKETGAVVRIRRVTPHPSGEEMEQLAEVEADETALEGGPADDDVPEVDDSRAREQRAESLLELDVPGSVWVLSNGRRASAEPDGSPPTLEEHSLAVHERARQFVAPLGLLDPERQAIELAALGHDVGKLDARFQGFLANGAEIGHAALAKSAFGSANPVAAAAAAEQAGLPSRFVHEAGSVEAVADALHSGKIPAHLADADPPLTLGVIAGHHGRGSPLWRVEDGGLPAAAFEVDLLGIRGTASGSNRGAWLGGKWFEMFLDLRRRYGPWAVAYLQALVALADRTVSQEGG